MTSKYIKHLSRTLLVAAVVFSCSGIVNPQASRADDLLTRVVVRDQNFAAPATDNDYGNAVTSVTIAQNGTVYIAGEFNNVGGQNRENLAAYTSTGSLAPWNPGTNGGVNDMMLDGSTIYIMGSFTKVAGINRNGAAAIDANGQLTNWNPNLPDNFYPSKMAVGSNAVFIAGTTYDYNTNDGTPSFMVNAYDKTSGNKLWSTPADSTIQSMIVQNNTLYIGGSFTQVNGVDQVSLAALNVSTGQLTNWNPNKNGLKDSYSTITAMAVSNNTLYVAGFFTNLAGQDRGGLASFDLTTGSLTNWGPNPALNEGDYIQSLAVYNGVVYAGGSFGDDQHYSLYNMMLIDKQGQELYWPIDMEANAQNYYQAPTIASLVANSHYLYVGAYGDFARYDLSSPIQPTDQFPVYQGPPPVQAVLPENVHSGEMVKFKNNGTIYLVEPEGLLGFSSYYSLQLYQASAPTETIHDINNVITPYTIYAGYGSAADYLGQYLPADQPYIPGTLVNNKGKGTIFLIMAGEQIPFRNKESFLGLGYSFKDVINADLTNSGLTQTPGIYTDKVPHTWGTWLNYNGTIYYSDQTGMIGVPDWDTFLSNGGAPQFIKPMNSYDLDVYFQDPNQPTLTYRDPRVAMSPHDPPFDPASYRDQQRLNDLYDMENSLTDYFTDNNQYPNSLSDLVPKYMSVVPTAPTPADGNCSSAQNTYAYSKTGADKAQITFCLGADSPDGMYKAGVNVDAMPTMADYRDVARLFGVSLLSSYLQSYKQDKGKYPTALTDLVPTYVDKVPTAPTPADGTCTETQNAYAYQKLTDTTYKISFCIGGTSPQVAPYAGVHFVDQDGNWDGKPNDPVGSMGAHSASMDMELNKLLK